MMMICSKCGTEHARTGQRYCASCHAAQMREWRKTHPMNAGQKKRDTARSHANMSVKRGLIEREPCCACGSADAQMHHPDHELPQFVAWLCRPCHLTWHAYWKTQALKVWSNWLFDAKVAARSDFQEGGDVGAVLKMFHDEHARETAALHPRN
jgi:hypothetical protein